MDRLKYRVWDKERKCFFNDDEFILYPDGEESFFNADYDFAETVVEQCTGLKDKNGKLIYEGDILGGIYGGYIAWCDEEKSFQMFSPSHECMSCSGDVLWQEITEDDGNLEVIGNIHENKDLLGDKTDEPQS